MAFPVRYPALLHDSHYNRLCFLFDPLYSFDVKSPSMKLLMEQKAPLIR